MAKGVGVMHRAGKTHDEIATQVGLSRSMVRNYVRLSRLSANAWLIFERLGKKARVRQFLLLCPLSPADQEKAAEKLSRRAEKTFS